MDKFKKLLDFFNILDDNGRISITNVGLIALIAKMAFAAATDWSSVVAVIAAFSNYAHKRSVNNQAGAISEETGSINPGPSDSKTPSA